MRCSRNPACVSVDGHADLCVRIDGTVILARRTPEATAQIAAAREPPDAFEERVMAMNNTSGLRKGLTEEQRIDLVLEEQTRGHIDRLRGVLSANRTPAGKLDAVLEEARSGRVPADVARRVLNESPSVPTPRVLTTNHPEVTDPGERARLGLDPVDAFGHVYRDPIEERMREVHAATPDPGPVFAVDPDGIDRRCDHAMFTRGCRSCTWRVPLDAQGNAIWPDAEPSLVLTGSDLATFDAFSSAAAALEQHAEQGQALQVAYRESLQAVSAMAARRNRGR